MIIPVLYKKTRDNRYLLWHCKTNDEGEVYLVYGDIDQHTTMHIISKRCNYNVLNAYLLKLEEGYKTNMEIAPYMVDPSTKCKVIEVMYNYMCLHMNKELLYCYIYEDGVTCTCSFQLNRVIIYNTYNRLISNVPSIMNELYKYFKKGNNMNTVLVGVIYSQQLKDEDYNSFADVKCNLLYDDKKIPPEIEKKLKFSVHDITEILHLNFLPKWVRYSKIHKDFHNTKYKHLTYAINLICNDENEVYDMYKIAIDQDADLHVSNHDNLYFSGFITNTMCLYYKFELKSNITVMDYVYEKNDLYYIIHYKIKKKNIDISKYNIFTEKNSIKGIGTYNNDPYIGKYSIVTETNKYTIYKVFVLVKETEFRSKSIKLQPKIMIGKKITIFYHSIMPDGVPRYPYT